MPIMRSFDLSKPSGYRLLILPPQIDRQWLLFTIDHALALAAGPRWTTGPCLPARRREPMNWRRSRRTSTMQPGKGRPPPSPTVRRGAGTGLHQKLKVDGVIASNHFCRHPWSQTWPATARERVNPLEYSRSIASTIPISSANHRQFPPLTQIYRPCSWSPNANAQF